MSKQSPDSSTLHLADSFITARVNDPTWSSLRVREHSPDEIPGFFWHGTIPLIEVALSSRIDGTDSGYLLVAHDQRLPPVIDYADAGPRLSHQLGALIHHAYPDVKIDRYVFFSSTHLHAEVVRAGKRYLLEIPTLASTEIPEPFRSNVDPARIFASAVVDKLRQTIGSKIAAGPTPAKIVLDKAQPVKYNQNCNHYSATCSAAGLGSAVTACSPNAIAGCVPVAWAMLFSALKRMGYGDSKRIWMSSKCWDTDWSMNMVPANPSKCPDVEKTIWKLHKLLSTTATGSTEPKNNLAGSEALTDFGVACKFKQDDNSPFDLATYLIRTGLPFLWGAHGEWPGGAEPKAGHGVVVYGYDLQARCVKLCMGWGASIEDRWVNWDQYNQTNCIHLTG